MSFVLNISEILPDTKNKAVDIINKVTDKSTNVS